MRYYGNGAWTKEGDANCWKRVTFHKRQPGTFHISKSLLFNLSYTTIFTRDRTIFQYDTVYPNKLYYTRDGVIWVSGNRHLHLTNCMKAGDSLGIPPFPDMDRYVCTRNGYLLMRKITRFELMFSGS